MQVSLQLGARLIPQQREGINFAIAAGLNGLGLLASCGLKESLAKKKRRKLNPRKAGNPFGVFRRGLWRGHRLHTRAARAGAGADAGTQLEEEEEEEEQEEEQEQEEQEEQEQEQEQEQEEKVCQRVILRQPIQHRADPVGRY